MIWGSHCCLFNVIEVAEAKCFCNSNKTTSEECPERQIPIHVFHNPKTQLYDYRSTNCYPLRTPFGRLFCLLARLCILILCAALPDQRQSVKLHRTLSPISINTILIIDALLKEYSSQPILVKRKLNPGKSTIRMALARYTNFFHRK